MNGKFSNIKKVLAVLTCAIVLVQCAGIGALAADISPEAVVYVRPEIEIVESNQIGMNYIYTEVKTNANNDQPIIAYLIDDAGDLVTMAYAPVNAHAATIKLGVPDDKDTGDYTVVVALNKAEDVIYGDVFYVGVSDVIGLFEAINMADVELAVVEEKLDSHYEALSVIESTVDEKLTGNLYVELGDAQTAFAQLILNGVNGKYSDGKGYYDAENSEEFVKEAYVLAAYNESDFTNEKLAKLLYDYSETVGFNAEDENLYAKIQDRETLVKIAKTMDSTVANSEELVANLESAVCVQLVNETHWLNLVEAVATNNELFNVDEDEIEELRDSKKLRQYFCEEFKATYYSVTDIQDAWEDAYKEAKKKVKKSEGGGGGVSVGGGTITNIVSTQITDDENNYDPNVEILDYYTDMAGYQWTSEAVLNLTKAGVVSGYGDKTFAPGASLTRAEFTKMIVNVFGLADITATCSFTDVDENAWYYIYIASAQKYGLAQGYGNGLFGVNDSITRQDAVTLIYRAAQAAGVDLSGYYKSAQGLVDRNTIAPYAINAVEALYNAGVFLDATDPKAVNMFEPTRNASRGYVAVLLNQVYIHLN